MCSLRFQSHPNAALPVLRFARRSSATAALCTKNSCFWAMPGTTTNSIAVGMPLRCLAGLENFALFLCVCQSCYVIVMLLLPLLHVSLLRCFPVLVQWFFPRPESGLQGRTLQPRRNARTTAQEDRTFQSDLPREATGSQQLVPNLLRHPICQSRRVSHRTISLLASLLLRLWVVQWPVHWVVTGFFLTRKL